MALCTNFQSCQDRSFGGSMGGYGKMWVYNLRSEFFNTKSQLKTQRLNLEQQDSRNKNNNQEHNSRNLRTEFSKKTEPRTIKETEFFFFKTKSRLNKIQEHENKKKGYERSEEPDALIPQIWHEPLEILF